MNLRQHPKNSGKQRPNLQQSLGDVQVQGDTKDRDLSGVIGASGDDQKEEGPRKTVADEPVGESGGTRKPIVIEAQPEQMNLPASENLPGARQQSAGDVTVSGDENAFALVNAAGNAAIDQSRHIIYNYYYREESRSVAVESAAASDDNLPCPYRGLFHFGPDDAEFFFGRQVFVTELVQAVEARAFIPILGAFCFFFKLA